MGTTTHGIKYPEMPDIPNVPDDIGGVLKLDQTTQAWLAHIDTTNLASLATQNARCATAEGSVSTTSASITTATTRQTAQQVSVGHATVRNDNIDVRLSDRDSELAATQASISTFPSQISALQTGRGAGLLGYSRSFGDAIHIPLGGSTTAVKSITVNNPSPNTNRIYRAMINLDVSLPDGLPAQTYNATIGLRWSSGTTYPGGNDNTIPVPLDTNSQFVNHVFFETTFTGISWTQWTLWATASGPSGSGYYYWNRNGMFIMTLEDIGIQL